MDVLNDPSLSINKTTRAIRWEIYIVSVLSHNTSTQYCGLKKKGTLKGTRWKLPRCEGVVELAKFIPEALLNGIGTEPMGHAGLEDLYYVRAGRNELPGTFLRFIPLRKTDRSIGIISIWPYQQLHWPEFSLSRVGLIQVSHFSIFRLC